jgi:hypothetical protein
MWGVRLLVVQGDKLIDEKIREMGGSLTLMTVLMEGHNNQPNVGVDGGKGLGEERRPRLSVWG